MNPDGRTVAPGRDRLAAAARAGSFPRSRRLVVGAGLLAGGAALHASARPLGGWLQKTVHDGIVHAVSSRALSVDAPGRTIAFVGAIAVPIACAAFAAGLAAAWIPAFAARRRGGAPLAGLPKIVPSRRWSSAVSAMTLAAVVLLGVHDFRVHAPALGRLLGGDLAAASSIGLVIADVSLHGGIVLVLAGLIDLVIVRHAVWRALHMTPQEARRERREKAADPRMRSALLRRGREWVSR